MRGVVPFYEEYDAMLEAYFNPREWKGLRHYERAEAVARYRLKRHIALHQAEAMDDNFRMRKKK